MKLLPELDEEESNLDDMVIAGTHESKKFTLIMDKLFFKNARALINILAKNPSLYVSYRKRGTDDEYTRATIGQALEVITNNHDLKLDQRFKGLGEMEVDIMFETGVNPLTRRLYRLTVDNWDYTIKGMRALHSKKEIEARKDMLRTLNVSYDDLDS